MLPRLHIGMHDNYYSISETAISPKKPLLDFSPIKEGMRRAATMPFSYDE